MSNTALLSLKQELKCWESMFQRKYGRKPTKHDIDESAPEIKECYKKYASLKKQLAGGTKTSSGKENTKSNEEPGDCEVFGSSLNKKQEETSDCKETEIAENIWVAPRIKAKPRNPFCRKQKKNSNEFKENNVINDEDKTGDNDEVMTFQISSQNENNVAKCNKKKPRLSLKNSGVGTAFKRRGFNNLSQEFLKQCKNEVPLRELDNSFEKKFEDSTNGNIDVSTECPNEELEIGNDNKNEDTIAENSLVENCGETFCLNDARGNDNQDKDEEICQKSPKVSHLSAPSMNLDADMSDKEQQETEPVKKTKKAQKKETTKRKRERDENETDSKSKKVKLNKKEAAKVKRLVSDNFVKIDLRKKTYQRGVSKVSASAMKRKTWKKKTSFELPTKAPKSSWGMKKVCFRCGGEGHWAKFCKGPAKKKNPFNSIDEEKNSIEFEHLNSSKGSCFEHLDASDAMTNSIMEKNTFTINDVLDIEPVWPRHPFKEETVAPAVDVLFQANGIQPTQECHDAVKEHLETFGYEAFREGQHDAVARVCSGLSTLVVLATGSGKSLCYQLPAFMYYKMKGYMTIVVSPLVALMQDQVANLPSFLPGAFLNSSMTKLQQKRTIDKIKDGKIAVLLVSPETLVSGGFGTGILPPKSSLPPLAFACVDEAHCLSEWSHNFRPSYLKVCKVLREKYNIQCLLGLTATASQTTATSVVHHLGIPNNPGAIIRDPKPIPENLQLSASRDYNRDQALVEILQMKPFVDCNSIIVYVTRRDDSERLASLLRTSLPERECDMKKEKRSNTDGKKERKPGWWVGEAYHAGLTPAHRKRIQKAFMGGELRIVVATVAFGMGLDKSDVRSVIHYNMPKSFENYVQEIGRAGRDGKPSYCHVFIDDGIDDMNELRRHIYGNTVDNRTIRKFVDNIFSLCDCKQRFEKDNVKKSEFEGEILEDDELDLYFSQYGDTISENEAVINGDNSQPYRGKDEVNKETVTNKNGELENEKVCDQNSQESIFDRENSQQEAQNNGGNMHRNVGDTSDCEMSDDGDNKDKPAVHDTENSRNTENDRSVYDGDKENLTKNSDEDSTGSDNVQIKVNKSGPDISKNTFCSGHRFSIVVDEFVATLDIPEENIATLMAYLELHDRRYIEILNPIRAHCSIKCYGGPLQFQLLAKKFPPVALALRSLNSDEHKDIHMRREIDINVCEIADKMCWDVLAVLREVRSLQWNMAYAIDGPLNNTGKSGIIVECGNVEFHGITTENIDDDTVDDICECLIGAVQEQEKTRLLQLDALYNVLRDLSCAHYYQLPVNKRVDQSARKHINSYFLSSNAEQIELLKKLCVVPTSGETPQRRWTAIASDVRSLMASYPDQNFTGRSMAKIFQGISSPNYPAIIYGRDKRFWRQYIDVDFNELRIFCGKELIRLKR